ENHKPGENREPDGTRGGRTDEAREREVRRHEDTPPTENRSRRNRSRRNRSCRDRSRRNRSCRGLIATRIDREARDSPHETAGLLRVLTTAVVAAIKVTPRPASVQCPRLRRHEVVHPHPRTRRSRGGRL